MVAPPLKQYVSLVIKRIQMAFATDGIPDDPAAAFLPRTAKARTRRRFLDEMFLRWLAAMSH
jgi:hypothetical protein